MSQTMDHETEIVLGNKQLLGIFFLLAVLIGVAFVGGYMMGRGSFGKRSADVTAQNDLPTPSAQTKAVDPAGNVTAPQDSAPPAAAPVASTAVQEPVRERDPKPSPAGARDDQPARAAEPKPAPETEDVAKQADTKHQKFDPLPSIADTPAQRASSRRTNEIYTPEPGTHFLQVAAEGFDSAQTVADVLTKAGFPAHVAAKPNDDKIFRVLVGPIKDNSDLTAKREALTKKGFTGMIPRNF